MAGKTEVGGVTAYREKVFPALAEGLWLVFLFLDLTGMADSTPVKFAAICLCAATAWTAAGTADGRLVAAALTLTVSADVFLLVLNRNEADQLTGVSLFILVQLLYAYRLYRLRGNGSCRWGLVLRLLGLTLLPGPALGLLKPLYALTGLYFLNLCVNALEALALKASKPVSRFAWGLLLFVGCDLCVGAWNLGLFGDFARVGMWLFYLPSQALIVLSQDFARGDPDEKRL